MSALKFIVEDGLFSQVMVAVALSVLIPSLDALLLLSYIIGKLFGLCLLLVLGTYVVSAFKLLNGEPKDSMVLFEVEYLQYTLVILYVSIQQFIYLALLYNSMVKLLDLSSSYTLPSNRQIYELIQKFVDIVFISYDMCAW